MTGHRTHLELHPLPSRRTLRATQRQSHRQGWPSGERALKPRAAPGGRLSFRRAVTVTSVMALVGTLALTTSIPATALGPMAGMVGGAPRPLHAQTLEVDTAYSTDAVIRDNYTVGTRWTLPEPGVISSAFGSRPVRPVDGVGAFHYGTDIAANCGNAVYAAASGTVDSAGWEGTYGNWILLDHGDGVQTGYAHNSQLLVDQGDSVQAGQVIALVGSTGASTGCHVHFEVRQNGARVDPEPFMLTREVPLG